MRLISHLFFCVGGVNICRFNEDQSSLREFFPAELEGVTW